MDGNWIADGPACANWICGFARPVRPKRRRSDASRRRRVEMGSSLMSHRVAGATASRSGASGSRCSRARGRRAALRAAAGASVPAVVASALPPSSASAEALKGRWAASPLNQLEGLRPGRGPPSQHSQAQQEPSSGPMPQPRRARGFVRAAARRAVGSTTSISRSPSLSTSLCRRGSRRRTGCSRSRDRDVGECVESLS